MMTMTLSRYQEGKGLHAAEIAAMVVVETIVIPSGLLPGKQCQHLHPCANSYYYGTLTSRW